MTTDVAPEVETPTLVTGSDAPAELPDNATTPVGDAGEQPIADAAPVSQESPAVDLTQYEAEADAYLKELEGKEGNADATEATRTQEPQREVDPSRNFLEHRQNTRARHEKVDGFKAELMEWGMPEASVNRFLGEIKGIINEEHGDGLRLSGSSAATAERAAMLNGLATLPPPYIEKLVSQVKRTDGALPPWGDVLKTIRQIALDEGKVEGEKTGRRAGYIDGRAQAERTASSAQSGQSVQGDPASGPMTMARWESLGFEGRERARQADPDIESKIRR